MHGFGCALFEWDEVRVVIQEYFVAAGYPDIMQRGLHEDLERRLRRAYERMRANEIIPLGREMVLLAETWLLSHGGIVAGMNLDEETAEVSPMPYQEGNWEAPR